MAGWSVLTKADQMVAWKVACWVECLVGLWDMMLDVLTVSLMVGTKGLKKEGLKVLLMAWLMVAMLAV